MNNHASKLFKYAIGLPITYLIYAHFVSLPEGATEQGRFVSYCLGYAVADIALTFYRRGFKHGD